MTDVVDKATRSRMMSGIRGKDTKPEMAVRRGLHRRGHRYKLHDKQLPGKPDLVLPRYKAVIFVQGCFWHRHECYLFKWPKSQTAFWRDKLSKNWERDMSNQSLLLRQGWRIAVVWECALKQNSAETVANALHSWLIEGNRVRQLDLSSNKVSDLVV